MRALALARQGWKQRDIAAASMPPRPRLVVGSPLHDGVGQNLSAPIPPRARSPSSHPNNSG